MKDLKKIKQQLKQCFKQNNIPLDEVDKILCEVLKVDYSRLFFVDKIGELEYLKLKRLVKKRLKGKPLTKIFKKAYFFGLEFKISKNVLSPRQETELLVEEALKNISPSSNVLDMCTGSGAIAVAIKKHTNCQVDAVDISKKALKIAKLNAKKNGVQVNFIKSDMFDKVDKKYDIILTNPPYIATQNLKSLPVEVLKYDPEISLDGGTDGLEFYRKLATKSPKYLKNNGILILEIGFDQRECVEHLLKGNNFDTICLKDYSQNDRVIIAKLKKV